MSVIGFFVSAFVFWRKGKEEHYPEIQLFDGFLLSTLFGLLVSRLGYIATHTAQFGWDFFKWLDVVSQPGTHELIGLIGTSIYLYRFALKHKWDVFEILDFWALSLAIGSIFKYIGYFLDGSLFGLPTNLPWGMVFPGVFEKSHPTQLYAAIFFSLLFVFLSWVEYRYRTFEWYRSGKKSAKTGFLLSSFIISVASFYFFMTVVQTPEFTIGELVLDRWIYLLFLVLGVGMLLRRADRSLLPDRKKRLTNDSN